MAGCPATALRCLCTKSATASAAWSVRLEWQLHSVGALGPCCFAVTGPAVIRLPDGSMAAAVQVPSVFLVYRMLVFCVATALLWLCAWCTAAPQCPWSGTSLRQLLIWHPFQPAAHYNSSRQHRLCLLGSGAVTAACGWAASVEGVDACWGLIDQQYG